MIIDATNLVLGRMSTVIAKKALLGEQIDVVNCENAVLSGTKQDVLEKYKTRAKRTTVAHGPFIPRLPDRFVRRTIRGMLPYKQDKGDKAFKRVMCYIGTPKKLEGQKTETIENASIKKRQITRFIKVGTVCQELGYNE